jgi:hypothetical protein
MAWVVPMYFGIGAFFGLLWVCIFVGSCAKRQVEAQMAARKQEGSTKPMAYIDVDVKDIN